MRVTGFAFLCLLFATRSAAAQTPALGLQLATPEPTAKVGGSILVRVTTVNESNQPVTYHNTNPFCNYSFEVLGSAGTAAPETDLRKRVNCGGGQLEITGRNIVVTLKPGENHSEEINISEQYDLSQPGQYSIRVSRTFPGIGHFTSNTVTVTVTP
jgi:hypothetical protein